MAETPDHPGYESALPFDSARIHAAAVYCSDGRFGEQCDDFLQNCLGLPRYDRVAIPGGPACLAGHFAAYHEGDAAAAHLEFLIDAHELKRVILIAHQDCAFYTRLLEVSPIDLVRQQEEDLGKAVQRIRELGRGVTVDTYFARLRDGRVVFEASKSPSA